MNVVVMLSRQSLLVSLINLIIVRVIHNSWDQNLWKNEWSRDWSNDWGKKGGQKKGKGRIG